MEVDDLNYLISIDVHKTDQVQGGLFAAVNVNTYASYNLSAANANAIAVGQFTQTFTDTQANLYQGYVSGHSTAYAKGTAYASNGNDTYSVRATERKSYWW
ncbi:MAG: hypothetical protein KME11_20855 [Timaviella obliquedivisa GSE-PSE-MK23-08B]|nr:hypothetical protein [Timaviella obliquedivisa GSE-PSE-MK23-08B]